MSIFSNHPPSFKKSEIKKIVFDIFGLSILVKNLDSDRDQNFYLYTSSNKEFVLKIYNPNEAIDVIDLQSNVLDHFQNNQSQLITVPKIINTISGEKVGRIIKNNLEYCLRLVSYVRGSQLKDVDQGFVSYCDLGSFIGELYKILDSFSDPNAKRKIPWDISNIEFLKNRLTIFSDSKKKSIISYFIKLYEDKIVPNNNVLPKSIIHNDCNDHNIIVRNNNTIYGIIDFGDMVYSYTVAEPAIAIAYAVLSKKKPFEVAGQILKGYCSINSLSEHELKSIIYLICIRLCISVTMAEYRSNLFPDNKYLMVSNLDAWNFLTFIHNEDLDEWSNNLVQYVR